MPPKRKNQGRFKAHDDDEEEEGNPAATTSSGYTEQHTDYRHRQHLNTVESSSSLFHLPPSPVKKSRTTHEDDEVIEAHVEEVPQEVDVGLGTEDVQPQQGQRGTYPSVRLCITCSVQS